MAYTKFRRGSGCYECISCKKKTRDTGEGEHGCEMCLLCYDKAGAGNTLSDEGWVSMTGNDPWDFFDEFKTSKEVHKALHAELAKTEAWFAAGNEKQGRASS